MDLVEIRQGNQQLKELLLQTAERYVRAGLQIVCVHSAWCQNTIRRGKAPTHFNWQKEALPWEKLQAEIERVWEREGGCNIGLKTGKTSGLVCVDVDAKSGGLAWLAEHEEHLGNFIKEHTANGGCHLYFRYPKNGVETASSARRIFKGVDILADGAGQVVTYPSIHASQECFYRFERGLDLIDALEEADELPQWIVDEVNKVIKKSERIAGSEDNGAGIADELDVKAASLALRDFPVAIEGDGGDLTTLKAALMCRDYGLSEQQVYELLQSEYNPRCSPPWGQKDLAAKVKNAFKYGRMNQGNRSISRAFEEPPTVPEEVNTEQRYSKKNAVHSAKVFLQRMQGMVDCYDGQIVIYSFHAHKWLIVSDSFLESVIYKDIERAAGDGELLRTMRVGHVSDIRKAVKMELNKPGAIPDAHWAGRNGKDFITLKNGILDVQTGDLLPHTPEWFSFHAVELNYDPEASCPNFLKFLEEIWDGDEQLIESLRLWMGYCLLSQSNFQKFAVFKGASRAGKSTLVGVLESMLGPDNSASTSLSLIGSDFGLESLIGKKMCVFQDADRASMDRMGIATERIKSLASNDPIGINRKGQTVVTQRMNVKISFVCNKMPPFLNDENSLTNRMVVFPFWKSFQGKEDYDLADRLQSEIQGVLNWGLVGARRLLRGQRLFTAQKGLEALEEITQQLDSVHGFIAECVQETGMDHNTVSTRTLWDFYREWCKDSGRLPKNKQKFFLELCSHRFFSNERRWRSKTDRGYWGIKLQANDIFSAVEDDMSDVPF